MTGTGIANFLVKATGPSILVSDLRLKTKILGTFLNNIDSIKTLQARIPNNIMDGGLSNLMSKRLQQLLDYSKQTQELENQGSTNRPSFSTNYAPSEEIKENIFSLSHGLTEALKEPWAAMKNDLFAKAPLPGKDKDRGSSLPAQFQKAPGEILVKKLNQYLHINQANQSPQPGANKLPAVDMVKERPGKAPTFSFAEGETSRPNSWPKMTEDQVAREINAFMKARSDLSTAGQTHQAFSPDDPGKIRIQNAFNIKLGDDGQREVGTLGSLAEKISDILREQALQHGIDIT
ncbi:MAG: hypothetical protein JSV88_27270 [Candidatus Aminicenantes bacterium]|nr:MAG: hypothetical protein JSV88_27270 [Candidatus Aminicenantes bacterium]